MNRRDVTGMFTGQKVLVVGLGIHGGGVATVQWLLKHGATVRVTDRRTNNELQSSIEKLRNTNVQWNLGRENVLDVRWADWLVQNPGVPKTNRLIQAAKKTKKLIQNEAGLFLQYAPGQIIGVTGTRGKTTTTLLIAHILKKFHSQTVAAGNLRDLPVLRAINTLTSQSWSVVELSSFQLEGLPAVRRSPHIAVWTNLLVDHLNRYKNLTNYANAKGNILRFQHPGDIAVLNADAAVVRQMAKVTPARICWYGKQRPAGDWSIYVQDGWIVERRRKITEKIVLISKFSLAGSHQHHNVLAAVGACRAAGVPIPIIRKAIQTFPSVPHRQQLVRVWRGHRWVNDTTATSPDGAIAAIDAFPGALYILGGTNKNLQFGKLVRVISKTAGPHILLPGSATDIIRQIVSRKKNFPKLILVQSMNEAVKTAAAIVKSGQDIVLTPGAASFGVFHHEFDRGDQFIRAVQKLR